MTEMIGGGMAMGMCEWFEERAEGRRECWLAGWLALLRKDDDPRITELLWTAL